jgi:hypothetical protein
MKTWVHFNALYKTKIVLISCFIAFQLLFPFAIYVIQMNCFGPKRVSALLACYVDGKGYATFKVKMLLLKKKSQSTVILTTSKKTNGFST